MVEAIIAISGLLGGFLIALGWYRRGLVELEKVVRGLNSRISEMEKDGHVGRTDTEVIKQRMSYMEAKIDDIHSIIMRPVKIVKE